MTQHESSYYPQRAGFFSPWRDRLDAGSRLLRKCIWKNPPGVDTFGLAASALIPGAGIFLRRRDYSGLAIMGICALLMLIFFAFLGFAIASIAFTLLLTIHLIGFLGYCKPWLAEVDFLRRITVGLAISVMLIGGLYLPLQGLLENHCFMPLQTGGHVVVVQCLTPVQKVKRGEWIAFGARPHHNFFSNSSAHGSVIVHDGINLAPVLAVAGDHVEFSAKTFSVNGVVQSSRPHMPSAGGLIVTKGDFFAWPELNASGYGSVPGENVTDAYMEMALVVGNQYLGEPLRHWFGRRQIFP